MQIGTSAALLFQIHCADVFAHRIGSRFQGCALFGEQTSILSAGCKRV